MVDGGNPWIVLDYGQLQGSFSVLDALEPLFSAPFGTDAHRSSLDV